MPTLNDYSDKDGVYIVANVGGSHPITLQVRSVAEHILRKAGYGDEDTVPTKVVWSMYDLGLIHTSSNISDPPDPSQYNIDIFSELSVSSRLTGNEKKRLLKILRNYSGPQKQQVNQLRDSLETGDDIEESDDSRTSSSNGSSNKIGPGARIYKASLAEEDFRDSDLSNARLKRANLSGANLQNANLTGVRLDNANLSNATLHGANLTDAYLRFANLSGVDLREVTLTNVELAHANLTGTNLENKDLTSYDLSCVDFTSADLRGVDFTDSNLSMVDFRGADIRGTKFDGAKFLSLANFSQKQIKYMKEMS